MSKGFNDIFLQAQGRVECRQMVLQGSPNRYVNDTVELGAGEISSFCWNPSIFDASSFALALNAERLVQVWAHSEKDNKYTKVKEFGKEEARMLAWAPFVDRAYHLIAAAAEGKVALWRCEFGYVAESREIELVTAAQHQVLKLSQPVA